MWLALRRHHKGISSDMRSYRGKSIWPKSHHHHHLSVMELGHLLTRSGLTYPEVSSKVCHDSFCQLGNSVSLPWVIYYGTFYLHVVPSFSCIPVICLKLVLFLIPLHPKVKQTNKQKRLPQTDRSWWNEWIRLFPGWRLELYISRIWGTDKCPIW